MGHVQLLAESGDQVSVFLPAVHAHGTCPGPLPQLTVPRAARVRRAERRTRPGAPGGVAAVLDRVAALVVVRVEADFVLPHHRSRSAPPPVVDRSQRWCRPTPAVSRLLDLTLEPFGVACPIGTPGPVDGLGPYAIMDWVRAGRAGTAAVTSPIQSPGCCTARDPSRVTR